MLHVQFALIFSLQRWSWSPGADGQETEQPFSLVPFDGIFGCFETKSIDGMVQSSNQPNSGRFCYIQTGL